MDIIQRNLFRLLRSGAFHSAEEIEPMSVFKWGRLYQLSVMHTVIPYVYEGINRCRSQFFLHLSAKQEEEWRQALREYQAQAEQQSDEMEEDELLRPDRLTNPLLNHRLSIPTSPPVSCYSSSSASFATCSMKECPSAN